MDPLSNVMLHLPPYISDMIYFSLCIIATIILTLAEHLSEITFYDISRIIWGIELMSATPTTISYFVANGVTVDFVIATLNILVAQDITNLINHGLLEPSYLWSLRANVIFGLIPVAFYSNINNLVLLNIGTLSDRLSELVSDSRAQEMFDRLQNIQRS